MDILCIEMKLLMMMNKLHIFTPRLRLISLDFWVDTLLSSFCNICLPAMKTWNPMVRKNSPNLALPCLTEIWRNRIENVKY